MSEDTTRNLPDTRSFEERVLAEFAAIHTELAAQRERQIKLEQRFDNLEEKVERRLMETRPIWEAVLAEIKSVHTEVKQLNTKFNLVIQDIYAIRADATDLTKRLDQLERA
ncbi:MAG: hypothetical protein ACR2LC_14210 [Pyrinomonadaceae bacterium]